MAVKVLVVDDSALMRKLFTQVFTARGYQVDSARDGEEALTKSAAFKPDVITLDINMPVMDGLTCLSLLRKFHQCPVLMLSSLTQKGALVTLEALALGADDFVLKPGGTVSADISDIEDELISKIEALTANVRRTAAPSKSVHTPQQTAAVKATAAPVKSGKVQVVMIGVSTGGPRKLEQILSQLPASFPCPVVVAQHMPKAFTAALAKRLNDLCPLEVLEVSSRMPLETGKVYIAKGDADVSFVKNQNTVFVRPIPASPNFLWHPSVDRMVESALGCFDAKNMLCVQLTGMGCDGVAAMSKAYSRGAVTIAESEATATVFGMPKELIQAGCASHVLDSHAIAQRINHLCKQQEYAMGLRKRRGESASQADRRKNSRDLASLIADLQASCADVRRWAARDLTNNLAARTALLEQIDIEHEPTVLEALFSAVEGMCDEDMAGALLEKLKSEDAQVRNGAIELLQSQPVLFAAHVNELLCDEDSDVRIFAVDVIGAIRHPDAATWLHNVVLNDNNINVVGTAVDKLSEIGDSGTLEILEKVSARFPGEAYIQFAIQCVRDSVAGEGV